MQEPREYKMLSMLTAKSARSFVIFFSSFFYFCANVCGEASADQIKAAFLFNFAKYVEWDAHESWSNSDQFNFCLLINEERFVYYKALERKTINNRPISVQLLNHDDQIAACHVVYVSEDVPVNIMLNVQKNLNGRPVLVVSEHESHGMIEVFEEEDKIKFRVNLAAAQDAGLTFRAQMLNLAAEVVE